MRHTARSVQIIVVDSVILVIALYTAIVVSNWFVCVFVPFRYAIAVMGGCANIILVNIFVIVSACRDVASLVVVRIGRKGELITFSGDGRVIWIITDEVLITGEYCGSPAAVVVLI